MAGSTTGQVSAGAVGGSAGEGGSEYRRGVVTYIVANGLAGSPLLGFGVPPASATVIEVGMETDDAVDDIRVRFASGWMAYVQAKRTLSFNAEFRSAVSQWGEAAKNGLDPSSQRLIIVSSSLTGPLERLARILEGYKVSAPPSLTAADRKLHKKFTDLLKSLTTGQLDLVQKSAVIHLLHAETAASSGGREAIYRVGSVLAPASPADALNAYNQLRHRAGVLAQQRAGDDLDGWVNHLRGVGVQFSSASNIPAGHAAARAKALGSYKVRLIAESEKINLRDLGAAIAPLSINAVGADIKVHPDRNDDDDGLDLHWAALRRGRVTYTGLPGSGKSTSLRRYAGQLCQMAVGPLPVLVSLKDVDSRTNHVAQGSGRRGSGDISQTSRPRPPR